MDINLYYTHAFIPTLTFDILISVVFIFQDSKSPMNLSHHIIVCLFSEKDSPLIGLGSFIMPLRASNFHGHELRSVVLLGNVEYLTREWANIKNFPNIYIMPVRLR